MENRRFILIALLAVVTFFLYQAWQDDYGSDATQAEIAVNSSASDPVSAPLATDAAPSAATTGDAPTAVAAESAPIAPTAVSAPGGVVKVITDVMSAEINLRGGELRRIELSDYPLSKQSPDVALPLLNDRDGQFFVFQSGLAGSAQPYASNDTLYTATQTEYRLGSGETQLEVVLDSAGPDGIVVRKTYRFLRGSYRVGVDHGIVNGGADTITVSPYSRLVRNAKILGDLPKFVMLFSGVGFYEKKDDSDGYRFAKTSLDDLPDDAFDKRQKGGWISFLQHYFVAAILPPQGSEGIYSAKTTKEGHYAVQHVATGVSLAPGATQTFASALYAGPRLQDSVVAPGEDGKIVEHASLDAVAPGLDYTVDYGILTSICEPLFWLLAWFHSFTGNWGVAIILLTLTVKAVFYKLSEAQYRSMAKMKKFAPRIQDLKERYGDDREKMSKAMMDLYKKEGFNPLAGCWPLLVQFPVFIALYWVLLESVELRQADFALWVNDLSAPDPFYVLPVLFGVSFYIQQKWSGSTATMDPMQQKIMNVMPIMMTAFFAFFQAGLVLYWLVSNLIGMAQQWYINRKLAGEGLGKAKPA
ncbi:MAG: membrane protein insertase YidC [Panacagrimonas sp.]